MRRLFWQEEEFYAKEIVKAFNASQVDIQVNLHILDKESYDSEITERIRAGEKVDVFDIRGISTLCDYQSQELLLDLTCQGYTRSEICRLRCVEIIDDPQAACINGLGIIDYLHMKNADHKKK